MLRTLAWFYIALIGLLVLLAIPAAAQDGARIDSSLSGTSQSTALGGNVIINQGGSNGTASLRTVPSTTAPGIITAHNCALGVSAGGSWLGGGISFGGSYVDRNCERISQAAAINTLAGRRAAIIHLAANPEVCSSLLAAGVVASCGGSAGAVTSTKSAAYSGCEYRDGRIRVRVAAGASRRAAVAQCRQVLGR